MSPAKRDLDSEIEIARGLLAIYENALSSLLKLPYIGVSPDAKALVVGGIVLQIEKTRQIINRRIKESENEVTKYDDGYSKPSETALLIGLGDAL